jgi:multicomponent Na+:H+ antiporter subunit E
MVGSIVRVLILTVLWVALQGSLSVGNLLLGVLFGGAIMRLSRPLLKRAPGEDRPSDGPPRPLRRAWRGLVLLLVFLRELVVSALQVAWYVVRPTLRIRPAIIEYPLDVRTPREITLLANLISLTPGTLSLDVSPDRSCLYVHAITVANDDGSAVIEEIKGSLEKHVGRALGPRT